MPISYKEFLESLHTVRKYQQQVKEHHLDITEKLDSISVLATVSRDTNM